MAAVSAPETAETEAETRGDEIRTADLVATALTRYAQAFATFGLMALVAAAFPALVVAACAARDADAEVIVMVGSFAAVKHQALEIFFQRVDNGVDTGRRHAEHRQPDRRLAAAARRRPALALDVGGAGPHHADVMAAAPLART